MTKAPKNAADPAKLPRAELRRQEIIMAAAAEFSRKGYAEATLADIAQRMGIHTAALYYYFENKDAVVQAVLQLAADRIYNDLSDELQRHPDASSIEKLKIAIRAYVRNSQRRDPLGSAFWKIYDQVAPELWEGIKGAPQTMFPIWEKLVTDAARDGHVRSDLPPGIFRHLLIGALIWMPEWYEEKGALSLDQVADAVITLFLNPVGSPAAADKIASPA